MRPILSFAVAGIVSLTGLASLPVRAAVLEADTHTFTVSKSHKVHIHFPVGQLRVVPTDDSRVQFVVRVRCRGNYEHRCEELANELVLDSRDIDNTLTLRLENYPKWVNSKFSVMGELRVPRSLALRVEMGVGDLDIEGLLGDLDVELGVGEADIRTLRNSASHVSVQTGIGDASIRGAGSDLESSRFLGARATWSSGSGKSDVRLQVGVGDATVRLE